MRDSSDIDAALVAKLLGDTEPGGLMTLLPDGVFMDEAGPSIAGVGTSKRFVIVSLVDEHDEPMFGGRAFEEALYLVKAVALSVINGVPLSSATMKAAAARIDALLELGTLEIPGYGLMVMRRESRVRTTEVDEVDPSIRWQHRGGRYQVLAAPTA
jgi:hypothetical protein